MGFVSLLQILFIGLKLGNVITWSWLLVMSPFIGMTILYILVFTGIAVKHYLIPHNNLKSDLKDLKFTLKRIFK